MLLACHRIDIAIVLALWVLFLPPSFGQASSFQIQGDGGESSSRRFRVEARVTREQNGRSRIVYAVVDRRSNRDVAEVEASFGTEIGHPNDSAIEHVTAADVYWNETDSRVAIDEYPLRYAGRVIVIGTSDGDYGKVAEVVASDIAMATGYKWDRYRVRAWLPEATRVSPWKGELLSVQIAGTLFTNQSGRYVTATFTGPLSFQNLDQPVLVQKLKAVAGLDELDREANLHLIALSESSVAPIGRAMPKGDWLWKILLGLLIAIAFIVCLVRSYGRKQRN